MDMSKYRALFVEESREHLAELSRLLVEVESTAEAAPLIDEIFRHAHSIKGMAGSMGYIAIQTLAHRMEDVVDVRRRAGTAFEGERDTIDCLLRAVDALCAQVDCVADERPLPEHGELAKELGTHVSRQPQAADTPEPPEADAPQPPVADAETPASAPASDTCEVRVRILEVAAAPAVRAFLVHKRLSELASIRECVPPIDDVRQGRLEGNEIRFVVARPVNEEEVLRALTSVPDVEDVSFVSTERAARSTAAEERSSPPAASSTEQKAAPKPAERESDGGKVVSTVRVRTEVLDALINSVGELFIARERLQSLLADSYRPELRAAIDAMSARIRELHDQVMAVRMMPMRTLTDRYPRLVRDLSRALGKDVELEVQGGDIELDRAILDNLDALFIHALRNAVDHGIESREARVSLGKASTGKIVISAARDRDMVLVEIRDDGRGLDPELLKEAAVRRGIISEEAARDLSAREAYFLICAPGFSTKEEVSDVSGRGVGMDAVRSKIESMGGSLDIDSELGRGTRFVLRLPLTLAIVPVLLVEVSGRTFAIPVAKVVAVREQADDIIRQAGGSAYLSFRHALVPVADLAALLQLPAKWPGEQIVVIEDGRDLSALAVSRILGYHEVVVKPLGDPLDRLEWFSGAAILGDGQPILILDLPRAMRQWSVAA